LKKRNGEVINSAFVVRSLSTDRVLRHYEDAVDTIGLWESEKITCEHYFDLEASLLDVGCGAGRTTCGLFGLGFKKIIGLDIAPSMVRSARIHAARKGFAIPFVVGNACELPFRDDSFDGVFFSFNGLMMIPEHDNRQAALNEVRRVLCGNGVCIFTTPVRTSEDPFWQRQHKVWQAGNNDPRLFEFGDVITDSGEFRDTYLRFPSPEEVRRLIRRAGMTLIDNFNAVQRFSERPCVKQFAGDCCFWVARKG